MMDVIYDRMNDDAKEYFMPKNKGESQIEKFYRGKKILLTGCTGYVGKTVMEKLLRTCKDLDTIYILVRPKKSKSTEERIDEYFKSVVFDRMRREHPGFRKKVVVIEGDLMVPDLGISPENRKLLSQNVNIVIHNGASVYFDEKISKALRINVLATQRMLEIAAECLNINAFMYVSTAYSHCYRKHIEEKFYPGPADLKMVNDIIRADTENANGITKEALNGLLGDWYNIYVFTKSISESLVEDFGKKVSFPCGVFRPSIVTATYKEPVVGWCGNTNGPVLGMIGIFLGILHVCQIVGDPIFDCIPADMTANALLASIWDLSVFRKPKQPGMYNYASGSLNPARLRAFDKYIAEKRGLPTPTSKVLWSYFMLLPSNYYVAYIYHILLHFIPALLADTLLLFQRKKTYVLQLFMKGHRNLSSLFTFASGDWLIEAEKMQEIWGRMNEADHEHFHSDLRNIDWFQYLETFWAGVRVYLLNDPMDTLPAAIKKYRKLEILHNTIKRILMLLGVYVLYRVACSVFS